VLYSASVPAELAFRRELEQLQQQAGAGRLSLRLHVTAPEWRGREAEWGGRWGRTGRPDLREALQGLQAAHGAAAAVDAEAGEDAAAAAAAAQLSAATQDANLGNSTENSTDNSTEHTDSSQLPALAALVCGPSGMEDAVVADLRSLGLRPEQIRFEKWW